LSGSATSGVAERVPTGGELTRLSRCRPWLAWLAFAVSLVADRDVLAW